MVKVAYLACVLSGQSLFVFEHSAHFRYGHRRLTVLRHGFDDLEDGLRIDNSKRFVKNFTKEQPKADAYRGDVPWPWTRHEVKRS